jgi:16S rRNA G527 N7-methylase RsmG
MKLDPVLHFLSDAVLARAFAKIDVLITPTTPVMSSGR